MSTATVAAPILVRQAIREHQSGNLQEASALYLRALEADPTDADALSLLGALHLQQGDIIGAVPYASKSILVEPRLTNAYNNLGLILKNAGQPAAAARCYYQATLIAPNFAEAHCNLGVVLKAEGQVALAVMHYRRAVDIEPHLGEAHNNLANALQDLGETEDAVEHYLLAADYMPDSDTVHYNVGLLLDRLGRHEEALAHLRRALELKPDRHAARHLVAALEGKTTEQAPREYIRDLFDDYAPRFEAHLVGDLRYTTHRDITDLLDSVIDRPRFFGQAFDLGCGTGLVGAEIRDETGNLVGVDLSERMLGKARAKCLYDELVEADLDGFLESETRSADLITATDVFVYLGSLDKTVGLIADRLSDGGLVIFSVETAAEDVRWFLRPSGRYAHGDPYVRDVLAAAGLRLLGTREVPLREERGVPIPGAIYLAAKPTSDGAPA